MTTRSGTIVTNLRTEKSNRGPYLHLNGKASTTKPQNAAIGPVHTNMGIFKTADFSMRFGRSSTCKRSIRSLKLKLFENSCQDEDFQKLFGFDVVVRAFSGF